MILREENKYQSVSYRNDVERVRVGEQSWVLLLGLLEYMYFRQIPTKGNCTTPPCIQRKRSDPKDRVGIRNGTSTERAPETSNSKKKY